MTETEFLKEEYAGNALEQIRSVAKGNGVKIEEIKIETFSGQISAFGASVKLSLRRKTSEKTVPGKKTQGTKTENAQSARSMAEKEHEKTLATKETLTKIKETVLERPDKGCGLDNAIIKLPFLDKEFYWHEACKPCNAKGELQCPRCHGQKFETCPKCHGQKQEMCPACRGARNIGDASGGMKQCPRCHGFGRIDCHVCLQAGKVPCPACRGQGANPCQNCGGQGWYTHVLEAENEAVANFDFDRSALSDNVIKIIQKLGANLPDYCDIAVLPSDSEITSEKEIMLHYQIRFAHAELGVAFGTKSSARFLLQGKEGHIAYSPDFLVPLIKAGLDALEKASQTKGGAIDRLTEAGKYKTVRHAIMAAAKYPRNKAAKLLLKNTPIGIQADRALQITDLADRALKNLTAKKAAAGVVLGVLQAGALYAAYMDTPLREIAISLIPKDTLQPVADFLVLTIGIVLSTETIRYAGGGALKKALRKILPNENSAKIIPRAGKSATTAAFICVLFFLAAAEMSSYAGAQPPSWYVSLRTKLVL